MVNIILHLFEQHDHGEGSVHRILDSPTHSVSNSGSWDPVRELYVIAGGVVLVFVTSNTIYMVGHQIASQMVAQDAGTKTQSLDRFGPSG